MPAAAAAAQPLELAALALTHLNNQLAKLTRVLHVVKETVDFVQVQALYDP